MCKCHFSDEVFIVNGQNNDIFTVPILDHTSVSLGRLYSAFEGKFLPGSLLWKSEEIEKFKEVIHHPEERTTWTSSQTPNEKFDLLDFSVSGSVGLNLEITEVKATGSFSYLQKEAVIMKFFLGRLIFYISRILNSGI